MSIEQEIYNKLVEQFGIGEICVKKYRDRPSKTWLEFIEAALKLEASELYGFCGFSNRSSFSLYFNREHSSILKIKGNKQWIGYLTSVIESKRCNVCKKVYSKDQFHKDHTNPDGLRRECIECRKEYAKENKGSIQEYNKEYYEANREAILEYKKDYYQVNKETILECRKEHYQKNKESILERYREYKKNNRNIFNALDAKRRATKLKATPKWADLEAIKEIYKNCPPGYHVDHEIPLQGKLVCGLHVHKNLKPIPAAENLAKGNKYTIV